MRQLSFLFLCAVLLFSCNHTVVESGLVKTVIGSDSLLFSKGFAIETTPHGYDLRFAHQSLRELSPLRFSRIGTKSNGTIPIPLKRIACLSTTHASYLADLGMENAIVGIGYANAVIDPRLKPLIESGKIQNITNANGVDLEKLVALKPDAFLVYSYDYTPNELIEKAGIQVIHVNEYEEQQPLARAEWLKLFGVLGDCLHRADSLFHNLHREYTKLRNVVYTSSYAPAVITASYYGGQWYVPGSKSFAAQLISDAGGTYLFHHKEGEGNVAVSFEELFAAAAQADYFGKVAAVENESRANFFEGDKRFEKLPCFQKNQLFLCNTRTADYFGRASSEPHVLLADLIRIFRPTMLPDHECVYFKPTKP